MSDRIRKAIFPVAGLGTRFLPATKANPKEMLPLIDKPLIQYVVEEAVEAGIDTLIFVSGRHKRSIEDHFDSDLELEEKLEKANKHEILEKVRNILPSNIQCVYMRQPSPVGLGHAVLCAAPVINNEPFAVLLADELTKDGNSSGVLSQLCEVYRQRQCSVIGTHRVMKSEIGKYGIVEGDDLSDDLLQVTRFIEKPGPGETTSDLAIMGRYILTSDVMNYLRKTRPGVGNEIQLTDALMLQLKDSPFVAYRHRGVRYDCGTPSGLLQATVAVGLEHPQYGEDLRRYVKSKISS